MCLHGMCARYAWKWATCAQRWVRCTRRWARCTRRWAKCARSSTSLTCSRRTWPRSAPRSPCAIHRRNDGGDARLQSRHVLCQPSQRASERLLVGGFVVAAALVAGEAVAGVVDMNFHIRTLLFDDLNIAHRDRMILVAEMQERRNLGLFVDIPRDGAAIVTDRARQTVEIACCEEGDAAAHAIAHDADRAYALDGIDRGRRVTHH